MAVGHSHPGLRDQLTDPARYLVDVVHPVVYEEDLAFPEEFSADGLGHRSLVIVADVGQDRLAVGGWGVNEAEVADSGQRHFQRPRDRSGGQGQDVHPGPNFFDRLLVGDPEALFLVDDQQAQLLEPDVVGEKAVGADHHVHRPVGQPGDNSPGLGGGEESAEDLNSDGVRGEAVAEGLAVLLGQQGGRNQYGGLSAVLDGLEDGSDRHLGLAESHVAAHQPVHGHRPFHVALDVLDGPELVWRLLEAEGLFQLALPRRVLGKGVAGGSGSGLVEGDEFLGDLGHLGAHPGLGLLPVGAPHPAEAGRLTSGVRPDGIDLVGGKVEPVVAPVLQQQVVAFDTAQGPGHQAAEAGHTVLLVDDVVTWRKVFKDPDSCRAPGTGPASGPAASGQLGLGDYGQPGFGEDEAAFHGGHDQ